MAVFSTNQVRQLYVALANKNSASAVTTLGDIALTSNDGHAYFTHMGQGGVTRSDLIDLKNVMYVKKTTPTDMARPLKSVKVTLDENVNGGNPISGQDYILRIVLRQYIGMSDSDQYQKYGMVHAVASDTASDFYKKLAISLAKNFSREVTPLLKFMIGDTEVKATTKIEDIAGDADSLIIEEVEQPWTLGIQELVPVYFDVYPTTVLFNGEEYTWGKATDTTPKQGADGTWTPALSTDGAAKNAVSNGKIIADLEYFCLGERADQYRNIGWPNSIPSKTMVDPSEEYYVLDIHYAYTGANECVQKSEKDITIVSKDEAVITALEAAIKALL